MPTIDRLNELLRVATVGTKYDNPRARVEENAFGFSATVACEDEPGRWTTKLVSAPFTIDRLDEDVALAKLRKGLPE